MVQLQNLGAWIPIHASLDTRMQKFDLNGRQHHPKLGSVGLNWPMVLFAPAMFPLWEKKSCVGSHCMLHSLVYLAFSPICVPRPIAGSTSASQPALAQGGHVTANLNADTGHLWMCQVCGRMLLIRSLEVLLGQLYFYLAWCMWKKHTLCMQFQHLACACYDASGNWILKPT